MTGQGRRIELWHLSDSDRVFASSPFLRISTFPQLGLLHLASVLRAAGHGPVYRDRAYDRLDREAVRSLVMAEPPLFVGLYSNIALRADAAEAIGWVREANPDVPVVVGGPGHFEAEFYFRAGAAAVVAGEAEEIVVEVADRLARGEDLAGIPGVRTPDRLPAVSLAPFPQDLEKIPRPAWDLAPPGRFRNDLAFVQRDPWYVQIASRGCPFRCAFCSRNYPDGSHDHRLRAPEAVIDEMAALHAEWGVRHVKFQDDTFGGRRGWTRAFCEAKLRARLPVTWNCSSHPALFRREPDALLALMRRAGCTSLHFGLQSTVPAILSAIHRSPEEPRHLAELVPRMRRAGLYTLVDLIVGLPGETKETIEAHRRYVRALPVHMIQVFPLQIVPGTDLARRHPDGRASELTLNEIHAGVRRIHRGFILRPRVLARNAIYILRRNPGYLLTAFRLAPYLARLALGRYRMAVWRAGMSVSETAERARG